MINQQSPFIQKAASVTNIMLMVILALVPGLIFYVYFFGVGVLLNVFVASLTALIAEYFVLKMRKLPPKVYFLASLFIHSYISTVRPGHLDANL